MAARPIDTVRRRARGTEDQVEALDHDLLGVTGGEPGHPLV
jgi:hypothetical protein